MVELQTNNKKNDNSQYFYLATRSNSLEKWKHQHVLELFYTRKIDIHRSLLSVNKSKTVNVRTIRPWLMAFLSDSSKWQTIFNPCQSISISICSFSQIRPMKNGLLKPRFCRVFVNNSMISRLENWVTSAGANFLRAWSAGFPW